MNYWISQCLDMESIKDAFRCLGEYRHNGDYQEMAGDMQTGLEEARKKNNLKLIRALERDILIVEGLAGKLEA